MKKLMIPLFIFSSIFVFGQIPGKFDGNYLVTGVATLVVGVGVGYNQPIEPTFISVSSYGEQIILRNFAGMDSIVAETKLDSFFVAKNVYEIGDCTYYLEGDGIILNDTLLYKYFLGSACIEGVFRVDCVGVKDQSNFLNDNASSDGIFRCYPNPAGQNINIYLEIPERVEDAILEVYQIDNRLIKIIELKNRGKFSQQINIEALNDGLLMFCILFDNKRKYSYKIIKQASSN